MAAIPLESEIFYPDSDGEPMAETEVHLKEMVYLIEALEDRFQDAPDVYVIGNLLLYYEQGNRERVVAPDVFMVRGVPKGPRRHYLLWEEGEVPCFVAELTSRSTRGKDLGFKKDLYERLGVEEYFLFDPFGESLRPRLQGFHLVDGRYRRIPTEADGALVSRTTGVVFRAEETQLRLTDAETAAPLLRRQEMAERLRALEQEIARLRREGPA